MSVPISPNASAAHHQAIYDMSRYDDLLPWEKERDASGKYISVERRRPGVPVNLARTICNTARDFLLCHRTFPQFTSEDETTRGIATDLRDEILLPVCQKAGLHAMIQGSAAITFGFVRGVLRCRAWPRTQSHPIFDDAGQLLALVIVYQGINPADGKSATFRLTLDAMTETWEVQSQGAWEQLRPPFQHNFGFVPAVWIRHFGTDGNEVDGMSLLEDLAAPLKAHDYSYSRENRALNYTADPTMVLKDKDPVALQKDVVRSPAGSMLLGENADAKYLEMEGTGLERQAEFRRDLRKGILEVARVVIMDSDKITGANLSGYALTVLHRPMIDLADSLKPAWNQALTELVTRILLASSIIRSRAQSVLIRNVETLRVPVPAVSSSTVTAWHPWTDRTAWPEPAIVRHLVDVGTQWGLYFAPSPEEYQTTVNTASVALASELASHETAVRMVAPITGVDPAEEVERIRAESTPLGAI
ncbi:phage portal protein [bacterium]|nr:phage portal protein [bacterium]